MVTDDTAFAFDTDQVTPRDRVDAFRALLVDATAPSTIVLDSSSGGSPFSAKIQSWGLGAVQVLHNRASFRHEFLRTPRQVNSGAHPVISLAFRGNAGGRRSQFGVERAVSPSTLSLLDLSEPYRFSVAPDNNGHALHVPTEALDLPPAIVRRAALRLERSPLYDLMLTHVISIGRDHRLAADAEVSAAVGRSTIALTRALLMSAADRADEPSSLVVQVRAYVSHHFTDPGIGPARIAAALNVSVRHLHQTCARESVSIEQLIIRSRLRAARTALADPGRRREPIAALAQSFGFRNPAHFSRRFRTEYGVTPSQWRAENHWRAENQSASGVSEF
ncbi:DNA-binding domain-containing protein, AraC-type [Cryptosporangium arvum DSM 44712]|uniref:DNA-binding domain-containing protein, AraC-type n=1 Tax=Cryptosporangium arvum DSM 44712 TaxID=927661 RepID=A0A010ZTM9_9ACTN|nr:DNA-binding domain-containing protein, AraC-type [Cryptosporangium arvum DSM 44712]